MNNSDTITTLQKELDWLERVISQVIKGYLRQDDDVRGWQEIYVPDLKGKEDRYSKLVQDLELSIPQRLLLALAMAPHLRPEALDVFFGQNAIYDRQFTEFGGVPNDGHSGFLPTARTFIFLLSSTEPEMITEAVNILEKSPLRKEKMIFLGRTKKYIPKFNGILYLSYPWVRYLLNGTMP